MNRLPDFREEKKLWKRGFDLVIGVDEVGRGAFAGPIVASAVALATSSEGSMSRTGRKDRSTLSTSSTLSTLESLGINDSKLLKPNQRKRLTKEIKKYCLAYGIGEVGVNTINKVGIGKATTMAMRKAIGEVIKKLSNEEMKEKTPNYLITQLLHIFVLVDAFHIKYLRGIGLKNQKAIKKGDQKSISIAAASIIAKVFRDSLMHRLAKRYSKYYWGQNKGYGTKVHQEAILEYGLTKLHRTQFVHTFLASQGLTF